MDKQLTDTIISAVQRTHALILQVTEKMPGEQIIWVAKKTTPSIAWHLWHSSRWADRLQATLQELLGKTESETGREIWRLEGVAKQWGYDAESLGLYETGTKMDMEHATTLSWPQRDLLFEYSRSALAAADETVAKLSADQLQLACQTIFPGGGDTTVGDDLVRHLAHLSRHLGMIEALRGMVGLEGTASI